MWGTCSNTFISENYVLRVNSDEGHKEHQYAIPRSTAVI